MFLYGTHKHQLDGKYRLRLPAKMRQEIGSFVLMQGVNGCLYVFNLEYFETNIKEKISQIPSFNPKYQSPKRRLTASMDMPEEDAQGRFVLDASLREFAGISKNIVIVGAMERAEIWDADRWDAHKKGKVDFSDENIDFDKNMALLDEFRI